MKQFKFNHNDWVGCRLSKAGAEHLTKKRKAFYDEFPMVKRHKENFEVGEVYRAQFWSIITDFHPLIGLGLESPFLDGELTLDSSIED